MSFKITQSGFGSGGAIPSTLNYGLFAQTSNGDVITGITPQNLLGAGVGTLSVPPNTFSVGDSFLAQISGRISSKNNETLRIVVYSSTPSGDIVLADTTPVSLPTITAEIFNLAINFTIRKTGTTTISEIISSGEFHFTKTASATQQGYAFINLNNTTFDTTVLNTLKIIATWGSDEPTNNIRSLTFTLNKIY